MTPEPLLETWDIHARINHYVLDALDDDALDDDALASIASSRGRSVGETFAHVHNVRPMWLEAAESERLAALEKVEKADALAKSTLGDALRSSDAAVRALLSDSPAGDGRVKGFRPHATAFLGYLISHESHHRGQIALALEQSGRPLDRKTAYGIWEWGVR